MSFNTTVIFFLPMLLIIDLIEGKAKPFRGCLMRVVKVERRWGIEGQGIKKQADLRIRNHTFFPM